MNYIETLFLCHLAFLPVFLARVNFASANPHPLFSLSFLSWRLWRGSWRVSSWNSRAAKKLGKEFPKCAESLGLLNRLLVIHLPGELKIFLGYSSSPWPCDMFMASSWFWSTWRTMRRTTSAKIKKEENCGLVEFEVIVWKKGSSF